MVNFDGRGGSFVSKLGSLSHSAFCIATCGWAGTSKQMVVKAGPKVVEGYGPGICEFIPR